MELEDIMVSEISQTLNIKYHRFSLINGSFKKKKLIMNRILPTTILEAERSGKKEGVWI